MKSQQHCFTKLEQEILEILWLQLATQLPVFVPGARTHIGFVINETSKSKCEITYLELFDQVCDGLYHEDISLHMIGSSAVK